MIGDLAIKLLNKWKREELNLIAPQPRARVLDYFKRVGVRVSEDVLALYSVVGGMEDAEMDSSLLYFWAIDYVESENRRFLFQAEQGITLFGDFLICSHYYGFRFEDKSVSSVYSDFETGHLRKISDSLEQFCRIYLTNPSRIGLQESS